MTESQNNSEEADLEQNSEHIRLALRQQQHREECGDATVKNRRAHIGEADRNSLFLRTRLRHEAMAYMRRVVDAETDGDNGLVCVCVRVRACACVRACVRVCVGA